MRVDGIVLLQLEFDVAGPMARNVADVALIHTAVTQQAEAYLSMANS